MKFGKLLDRRVAYLGLPATHYVDYKGLGKIIKIVEEIGSGDKARHTAEFYARIYAEVAKVNAFFLSALGEAEAEFECLCAKFKKSCIKGAADDFDPDADMATWRAAASLAPGPVRSGLHKSFESVKRRCDMMRTFVTLNHIGFRKILKKMDRRGGLSVQHEWMATVRAQPFYASMRFARLRVRVDCLDAVLEAGTSTGHSDHDLLTDDQCGDFDCAICMDPLHRPVVLPCAHRFCESCVYRCYAESSDCPICRSPEVIEPTLPVDRCLSAFIRTYVTSGSPTDGTRRRLSTITEVQEQVFDSEAVSEGPGDHLQLGSFEQLVRRHSKAGAYVVLDIDETIFVNSSYPCMLLTNHGIPEVNRALQDKSRSTLQTRHFISNVFRGAMAKHRPAERCTASVIQRLQEAGVRVFALTSRGASTHARTREELLRIGLDLNRTSPFPPAQLLTDPVTRAECRDGVIYTNAQAKGPVLNRFLEGFLFQSLYVDAIAAGHATVGALRAWAATTGKIPPEIVFVDDRPSNLDSVKTSLKCADLFRIPVTTYHYALASYSATGPAAAIDHDYACVSKAGSAQAAEYDVEVARLQLELLLTRLIVVGDADARDIRARRDKLRVRHDKLNVRTATDHKTHTGDSAKSSPSANTAVDTPMSCREAKAKGL